MYFWVKNTLKNNTKNILKNNHYHTFKYPFKWILQNQQN